MIEKLTGFIICSIASTFTVEARSVMFNEIMQSNVNGIMYKSDFPDSWLELYNPTENAINITHWRIGLTNEFENAWEFRNSMTVFAHDYLLVYCDKLDNGYQHTNFRLDANACTLYLWDANGVLIDSLSHPKQLAPNVAYGRTTDGGDEWNFEVTSTPETSNDGVFTSYLMPDPEFSMSGRLLDTKGCELVVSIPDNPYLPADTRLVVTTDGSFPTSDSPTYSKEEPFRITINNTTVVRARLISNEGITNLPATNSYILHPRATQLPIFSLSSDSVLLWGDDLGMLIGTDYDGNCYKGWRRPINFEFYEQEQPTQSILNQLGEAGMHGAGSMLHNQKAMNLYTNKRWQKKRFDTSHFWPHKPFIRKSKTFCLRNGGSRCADSRFEDAFVQLLFAEHIDNLEYLDYRPSIVYINGKYRGIYDIRERANNTYAENNFDIDEDEVTEIEDFNSNDSIYKPVKDLLWDDNATYADFCRYFDMPLFLDYTCCQAFATNTLFPGSNVFMWVHGNDLSNKIHPVLKDLDELASTANSTNWYNFITLTGKEGTWGGSFPSRRIYVVLFAMQEFQNAFLDRMQVYLGDFCKPSVTVPMVEKMRQEIDNEITATFEILDEVVTYEDFANRIEQKLIPYCKDRPMIHYQHLALYFNLGDVIPMTVNCNYTVDGSSDSTYTNVYINDIKLTEGNFDGALFSNRVVRLRTDDPSIGWRIYLKDLSANNTVIEHQHSNICFNLYEYGDGYTHVSFVPIPLSDMSIEEISLSRPEITYRYDIMGRLLHDKSKGVNLIRYDDGTFRKIIY